VVPQVPAVRAEVRGKGGDRDEQDEEEECCHGYESAPEVTAATMGRTTRNCPNEAV